MTMNTRVHIAQPTNPEALFLHLLDILQSDPLFSPSWEKPAGADPWGPTSPGPLMHGKASYKHVRKGDEMYRHARTGEPIPERASEYRSTLGQGLGAILEVTYADDAPLTWPHYEGETCEGEDCCLDYGNTVEPPRQFCLAVSFDTAYGYHLPNGAGCADLHALLLLEVGRHLASVDITEWVWHHEEAGTWHGPIEIHRRGNPDIAAAHFGRAIDEGEVSASA